MTICERERQPIKFRSDDDMLKRAENIWHALGFVDDRHGAIPRIAAYLFMYQDWDRNHAEQNNLPEGQS